MYKFVNAVFGDGGKKNKSGSDAPSLISLCSY